MIRSLYMRIPAAWRPFVLFCVLLLLFLVGGAVYLSLAAKMPALFACRFARNLHFYCPGCGGSRALYALLRLDLLSSLAANPALLALLAVILYYGIALFRFGRGRGRVSVWPAILFAAFLVVHFLLRNILLVFAGVDPLGDLIQHWR